ncbi:MAG: sodium:proline symporter [Chthoniobacterales bacterium]
MHLVDWLLVALPLVFVMGIAIYTQRQMKSVADFMSGGRMAGPYLLAVASGELQAGAVVFVAGFEQIAQAGFTTLWWSWMSIPAGLITTIFGFVYYRFRETRAMTLSQFFELRYSKSFRIFTGCLGFFAGIVNFGIIPAVGARCMIYFFGLPAKLTVLSFTFPTYILLMAVLLSIALFMALAGGLLTVMITDCVEGMVSQIFYLIIIVALLTMFSWNQISEVLLDRLPTQSMVNPFDSKGNKDFNGWIILIGMLVNIYSTGAWQNSSGYRSAAITPHAAVMGGILGRWRESGKWAVMILLAVCAITFLKHPDFAAQAAAVHAEVSQIDSPQIQKQMEVPVSLSHLLPIGIKGILCAVLLMGIFGGDATHLHSWGGIFVQDVLVPLRKKPFGPEQHIRVLRWSIVGVAVFAFLFGALFQQTEYISMWWSVTMAIYVGGAGAAIIGGLYWKKGTTTGAWTALIAGSSLSVTGILLRQIYGNAFPLNGVEISFYVTLLAIALYVGISLLTNREDYNMDRMLHRGKYAAVIEKVGDEMEAIVPAEKKFTWGRIIGFDENFSRSDKWITGSVFAWGMVWFSLSIIGTIWNLIAPWPVSFWTQFWRVSGIGIPIVISVVTGIWFTWGGVRDIKSLFQRLKAQRINHLDDGTVVNNMNLDETTAIREIPQSKK